MPTALEGCKYLGDEAFRKKWSNRIKHLNFDDVTGQVVSIIFRVSCGKEGIREVTLLMDDTLIWHKVCQCDCNWTLQSGRPCMHASFCLKWPNLGGNLQYKDYFGDFSLERKRFYHKALHVDRMIQQYSCEVRMPQYSSLENTRVWLPTFLPQPGKEKYLSTRKMMVLIYYNIQWYMLDYILSC